MADAATTPGGQHPAVLQPIVERLGLIAAASGPLHSVYEEWAPVITAFLQNPLDA